MKKYFKYFCIPFIIVGVLTIICAVGYILNKPTEQSKERTNKESALLPNVFDFAGRMSESNVKELDDYIAKIEEDICVDIAVVTLDQSLEGYAEGQPPEKWVKVFADNFADQNEMGYDKPRGDNIVFVDNVYREPSTGKVYSWISTSGKAKEKITQSDCEAIMYALDVLEDDSTGNEYVSAYKNVVKQFPSKMRNGNYVAAIKVPHILLFALVVSIIYILVNWRSKLGKQTTVPTTYIENGAPVVLGRADTFIRKTVTKTRRETSSGGGGGGGGHGGGGHSR